MPICLIYKDTHEPFLIFLHQSLTNYSLALEEVSTAINSFESDSNGYVSQSYLEGKVTSGFDKVGEKAKELVDEANEIKDSVEDIVAIPDISESELMDSVSDGKDKVSEIVEKFVELDKEGTTRLEATQSDLATMETFLSEMSTKFDSSASISSYSIESTQDMEAYQTMKDYIYDKDNVISAAMYGDNLESLTMTEIEKGKNEVLNELGKEGKDNLNQAYIDLETGKIDKSGYTNILQSELADSIEQGHMSEESRTSLWEYIDEKKGEIGVDFAKDAGVTSAQQGGLAFLRASLKKSDDAVIKKGPKGPAQWTWVEEEKVSTAQKYSKAGKALKWTGKVGGPALSAIGLHQGYKNDIADGKTPGEAVSHTGGSFLTGFGASGSITLGIATFIGPVGWVGAGVAVVAGGAATLGFNALYDNNEKFRAGVDGIGNKLDEGVDWLENKGEDMAQWTVDKVANSSVYKKIESEVTDVKQKAGEAVNQVINETVNLGKEKLNDVKKSAGEALKEKFFGPKIPKMNWGWN